MLHILLLILKIIGIILLILLALIFLILGIILFVPVRYEATAEKYDKLKALADVTWLFKLVQIHVSFQDKKLQYYVRVAWKKLMQSEAEEEPVSPSVKEEATDELISETVKKKETEEELVSEPKIDDTETDVVIEPVISDEPKNEETCQDDDSVEIILSNNDITEEFAENKAENSVDELEPDENDLFTEEPEQKDALPLEENLYIEGIPIEDTQDKTNQTADITLEEQLSYIDKIEGSSDTEEATSYTETTPKEVKQKVSLKEKLLKIKQKLSQIKEKITGFFTNTQKSIDNLKIKYNKLKKKADIYYRFITNDITKAAINHVKKEVFYLLRHFLPKKVEGDVCIGFEDPATTGKVLGYICVVNALLRQPMVVRYNFEEKIMEGKLHMKGHIRLCHGLKAVLALAIDRNIWRTIKRFKKLRRR